MLNDIEKVLINEAELQEKITLLAKKLDEDYKDKNPLLICILKGSVLFFSDLVKKMKIKTEFEFMSASSYGSKTYSTGKVKLIRDINTSIEGRHVLLIEDIIDSGHTLSHLIEMLKDRKPASIKTCTLLDKKCRRVVELESDYSCFDIDDYFVVGYGLDYDEYYRNLPFIGILKPEVYTK